MLQTEKFCPFTGNLCHSRCAFFKPEGPVEKDAAGNPIPATEGVCVLARMAEVLSER